MIDRYLLRYFLAVIDCGTFSRAAAQTNVAQPTLSVGIAKLERLLGKKLFERSSQRVHLTEAGSRLALHARRIENEFNLAAAAVLSVEHTPLLRLGILSTITTAEVAGFAAHAAMATPEVRIELVEGNERGLLQHLSRGRIDVALTLVRDDASRFTQEALRTEGYALALSATHPLAGESDIAAEAVADDAMIVRQQCEILSETSRHFTERGIRPFFSLKTTNDDRAWALVRAGLGVTVMPRSYSGDGIAMPRLIGFNLVRTVGLVWADHAESLYHSAPIITLLRQHIRDKD